MCALRSELLALCTTLVPAHRCFVIFGAVIRRTGNLGVQPPKIDSLGVVYAESECSDKF